MGELWCSATGKMSHASEAEARTAAQSMKRRGRVAPGKVNVYRCEICEGWHLGHDVPSGATPLHRRRSRPWPKREG
jgi:hypothetical protein